MSVILGLNTGNTVILGADKRLSTYNNKMVSDDGHKIVMVNNHLAFANAGNAAAQKMIELDIEKLNNKEDLVVEDVLDIIKTRYKQLEELGCKTLCSYSAYFIIAGMNKDGKLRLCSVSYLNGILGYSEENQQFALFPPNDVSMQVCSEIYIKNIYENPANFVEKTVKDISELSCVVSSCGDKWVFDYKNTLCKHTRFE